MQSILQYIN